MCCWYKDFFHTIPSIKWLIGLCVLSLLIMQIMWIEISKHSVDYWFIKNTGFL